MYSVDDSNIADYNLTGLILIFILVWRHVTFKLRVFHLRQTNFASYAELAISALRGYLLFAHFKKNDCPRVFDNTTPLKGATC